MRDLFLGVDVGTASTKGVLVDTDGTVVASAVREHELSLPQPGWAEHDAEATWWEDFVAVSRELTAGEHGRVTSVGVSGIGPCLLAATAAGTPLRPAILYGIDTRATAEIDDQQRRYGADAILARCGSPLTSQAIGPKIEWLRRHEPEVWTRTDRIFMASSFLVHRLTGAYILDHHSASQSVPMYDLDAADWASDWCADIAPGLRLPELAWPGDVVGTVSADAARLSGITAGTPVVAGTVDAWAEALSVGVRRPGDLMLMYGSTMFLVQVVERPLRSPALWGTAGVLPGTYCLAGGMATSGALTEWLRRLTGADGYATLTDEAAGVPAGSDGLLMLPYFAGERTPLFDVDARGVVAGLTLRHGREHLYRAALEATAFGIRHNLEAMSAVGADPGRLVAVGGGTRGGLWTRIVSDILDRQQQVPAQTVGASLGDAMLAARAVAPDLTVDDWNPVVHVVEPTAAHRAVYDELYGAYRSLYPATREQAHLLARIQRSGSAHLT
ncbi:FGGY-family carbohydrate kinase [Phytoactinopolyspora limicola]|uniref:FGGY-family carbohydrate kinase n=1 Tax=Phytoactinopolyspora limicola TaxID=2715536 RepID=UPI001409EEC6|nr:FGGY-family carbohydrate kinase [Phytoactinopolyspora limicola]